MINELFASMTTREKITQMTMRFDIHKANELINEGLYPEEGLSCIYISTYVDPEIIDRVQKYNIENTRCKIPIIFMGESLHGVMFRNATVFPQAIGLGASFNTELITQIADVIGKEARSVGIRQTYAPNLDLSRDPRWGRVEENYGEDPYLTACLGAAYVKALQKNGVAASPKHFIAHGSPESGINIAPVHIGLREFYENMYEPFDMAIREAGAMSVMPAYSEFDGIPVHTSKFLLDEILRRKMNFEGFTVSDFGALYMLLTTHHTADNALEIGIAANEAGIDIEAPSPYGFGNDFLQAAEEGRISIESINKSVLRILKIKEKLGLFSEPYIDKKIDLHCGESITLAKKAALETIVLLKNNGILPIKSKEIKIAVVGPNADNVQLGDYTSPDAIAQAITVLAAFREKFGNDKIIYAKGCNINNASDELEKEFICTVNEADLVIAVMGDNSNYYGGIGWGDSGGGGCVTCGEGYDVHELLLPKVQRELLAKINKPLITVIMSGRPYSISDELELSDALFMAWYPGEQGGNAVCDLILGEANPSGKLPISIPRSTGHIPCFYNHKISARGVYHNPGSTENPGRDYVFSNPGALFEFGYGLSYTEFVYSDLTYTNRKVSVTIKNNGKYDGYETVLLFVTQCYCRITPFVRRLRKFKKVYLKQQESIVIDFFMEDDDFSFINENMEKELGKGKFIISVENLKCEIFI